MRWIALSTFIFILTVFSVAYADTSSREASSATYDEKVATQLRQELGKRFPGARIDLTSPITWVKANVEAEASNVEVVSIRLGDENARGEVPFGVESRDEDGLHMSWARASFNAMIPARIAVQRVLPGEPVTSDQFVTQDLNIAYGATRDIRGLILSPAKEIGRVQARQTILEGQPLLASQVERVPDVRRGDAVKIELISGDLTLTTLGTASEPGFLDSQLHVISQKTKRELIGKLMSGGIVEVRL